MGVPLEVRQIFTTQEADDLLAYAGTVHRDEERERVADDVSVMIEIRETGTVVPYRFSMPVEYARKASMRLARACDDAVELRTRIDET